MREEKKIVYKNNPTLVVIDVIRTLCKIHKYLMMVKLTKRFVRISKYSWLRLLLSVK